MLSRARPAVALVALLALTGGAQAATGRPSRPSGPYVVAHGETLSELAARVGVSTASLARVNRIRDPNRIRMGQRLVIPRRTDAAARRPGVRGRDPRSLRVPDELRRDPRRLALAPRLDAAARRHGVPPDLLKAVTWMESGWQNDKVSSTKATGIGQLMPDTVTFVSDRLLGRRLDPRRPEHNMDMSARFLRYLLDATGGNTPVAVASYYQGLSSVRRQGPLRVTNEYVADVLALRAKF